MDVAGFVKVKVQADLTELERGLAKGREATEKFDRDSNGRMRDARGRYVSVGSAAKQMGDDVRGAAARAAVANDNVRGSAMRVATAYERVQRSVLGAARSFMAMTAASLGAVAIVRTLAGFEQSMASVSAITRASAAELAAMRDIAKELGATTEFTASQAADGLKFLGMAGFNAAQSIAAIPDVLNLATAAQMDLARAADISSNIMSAFGIAAEKAGSVADILAAAASRANTDVLQLGDAMKYAGPVASALGITMGDTAAAIGTLSDAGIQGSMAGTGLRQVLAGLANITPQAAKAIKGLGLTVQELNPATNSLVDIVGKLRDSGMDAATALTIFGDRGGPAILALTELEPKLRRLTGELGNVEGEAKRMAETMRDNLSGDLKGLASALESVVIALGEAGLVALLRTVTQGFTVAFRTAAQVVTTLGDMLPVVGMALMVAFGPAVLSSIAFGFGYMGAAGVAAVNAITAAMARNPLGAIAIGITIAITAIYHFRDEINKALGVDVFGIVKRAANYIIGSFVAAFEDIKFVWNNFPAIMSAASVGAANALIAGIEGAINILIPKIKAFYRMLNPIAGLADMIGGGVGDVFGTGMMPDAISIERMGNPGANRLTGGGRHSALSRHNERVQGALNRDYLGGGGAPDFAGSVPGVVELDGALRKLTDTTGGADKAAEKAAKAYEKIVVGAQEFIEKQKLEQEVMGLTAEEANRLRYEQDLLNEAMRAGINLTAAQKAELAGLAAQMAAAEAATKRMAETQDAAKEAASGFGGIVRGLIDGTMSWKDALISLIPILLKLLNTMAGGGLFGGGLFQSFLGGLMGIAWAKGGAFSGGNVVPFAQGGVVTSPTVFPMAKGATGLMGEAGPEAIMPLKRGPDGALGVRMFGANDNYPSSANDNVAGAMSAAAQAASTFASAAFGAANNVVRFDAGVKRSADRMMPMPVLGAGQGVGPQPVELHITGQEGPMFRPTIEAVANGVAVKVVDQRAPGIAASQANQAVAKYDGNQRRGGIGATNRHYDKYAG